MRQWLVALFLLAACGQGDGAQAEAGQGGSGGAGTSGTAGGAGASHAGEAGAGPGGQVASGAAGFVVGGAVGSGGEAVIGYPYMPPAGCVDIWVDKKQLPAPKRDEWGPEIPFAWIEDSAMFARTANGLVVGYTPADSDFLYRENGMRDFFVAVLQFNPKTGAQSDLLLHPLWGESLPAGVQNPHGDGFVASDDVGAIRLISNLEKTSPGLYVFPLSSPGDGKVWIPREVGTDRAVGYIFHVGWDGEAFVVHHFSADGSLYAIRVSPEGEQLTDSTRIGAGASRANDGVAFHTDPVTGHSWYAGTNGESSVWVLGHERNLAPLGGMTSPEGMELSVPDNDLGSANLPAIASSGSTVVVSFNHRPTPILMLSGDPLSVTQVAGVLTEGDDLGKYKYAVDANPLPTAFDERRLAKTSQGWTMVAADKRWIELVRFDEGGVKSRHKLVVHDSASGCVSKESCKAMWPVRWPNFFTNLQLLAYGDELWFGFEDVTLGGQGKEGFKFSAAPYRIVKADESCQYHTLYDIAKE